MKKGKVSIWLGNFNSQKELESYVKTTYNDDEDDTTYCPFKNDYKITLLDEDFLIVAWKKNISTIDDLVKECSYWESYIEDIRKDCSGMNLSKCNSIIAAFDNDYNGKVKHTNDTMFLNAYEYTYEMPDYMKAILADD
jgi:hypothetical protein